MAMWQHMFGVYVWGSVWRCKLDCVQFESRLVRYVHTLHALAQTVFKIDPDNGQRQILVCRITYQNVIQNP